MKSDRHLDEPLPDFFLFLRCSPPHVFQDFMSVEELALVEQGYSVSKVGFVRGHSHGPRRKENLAPQREVSNTIPCLGAEDPIVGTGGHEE